MLRGNHLQHGETTLERTAASSTWHSTEAGGRVVQIKTICLFFSTASLVLFFLIMKWKFHLGIPQHFHRESDIIMSYRQLPTVSKWNYPSSSTAWKIQSAYEAKRIKMGSRPKEINELWTRNTSINTIYGFPLANEIAVVDARASIKLLSTGRYMIGKSSHTIT